MRKAISSRASITGLFISLLLILTVPLIIVTTQNPQDLRQRAASLEPTAATTTNANYISGYVFYDQNKNGQREHSEAPAANINLTVSGQTLTTDQNGFFKHQFTNTPFTKGEAEGKEFLIHLLLPDDYKTINTNPKTITLESGTSQIIEFGIFPIQPVKSLTDYQPSPTIFDSSPKAR